MVGFRFFGRETERIHVVVRRGARYHRMPGVTIHESRRFEPQDVDRRHGVPCTEVPRSAYLRLLADALTAPLPEPFR